MGHDARDVSPGDERRASAVTGYWGPIARRIAIWLLDHDAVHVLATDAHDDKNRPPILSEARDAVSKRFHADVARALVVDHPAAIVAGPLPFPRRAQSAGPDTTARQKNRARRRTAS
jgi:tyrosine-protein phosphatase YwqE